MSATSIIRFEPIYQTRIWGGRTLETRFGRDLPDDGNPYGESWEISARDEADSVVASGPLRGRTLRQLWKDPETRSAIFGPDAPGGERFPLLCKILDAREKLSIQVHPPASVAEELDGEPKTEVWYIADADPGAELYVGVREGVTAESFRSAIDDGTAEEAVHVLRPAKGDYIFIESGRLHAIGAGLLIYEIQQNSDTTYRVFDWNRPGLDGKPRQLHIEESMKCIDFDDVTPEMDSRDGDVLCDCEHFRLEEHGIPGDGTLEGATAGRFAIVTVVEGNLVSEDGERFREGDFFLVAHGSGAGSVLPEGGEARVLVTTWPGKNI